VQHELLPVAAFAGSLVTTVILYATASRAGRTSIAIFLLAGLAIAAIANAGTGLLVFAADDRQLRDTTFWLLGSTERRELDGDRNHRAGAGARLDRVPVDCAGSTCWCSARPRHFTAASMSSG
jgi:FecCD transport family